MKKSTSSVVIAALLGLVVGILIATGRGGASAQQQAPTGGSGNLGSHHKELVGTLPTNWVPTHCGANECYHPSLRVPLDLPKADTPTRIDVVMTGINVLGQPSAPIMLSGVFMEDVATNSFYRLYGDSQSHAEPVTFSMSLMGTTGSPAPEYWVIASIRRDEDGEGLMLMLEANQHNPDYVTSTEIKYAIHMWY